MGLARRNLLRDKGRLALSIAGVALATALVLLLSGFVDGLDRQLTSYLDQSPGTLVVSQAGIKNMLVATSVLPQGTAERVRGTDGVASAVPLLSSFVILEFHDAKQAGYLVGFDPLQGGGPRVLSSGRQLARDDEAIIDRTLAQRHDLALGDTFDLMGQRFTIVGLSEGTGSWMTGYVFVRKAEAETLFKAPGMTSFLLVTPTDGLSVDRVRADLAALAGVTVTPKAEVAANDVAIFGRFILPAVRLMTAIAFLVGTLIVGLVLYSATVERQREYGVLKAIGARARTLYGVTLTQAAIITFAGAAVGLALALGAAQLVMVLRPQFQVTFLPLTVAVRLASSALMALLAVLLPARIIASLAPADVFRRS